MSERTWEPNRCAADPIIPNLEMNWERLHCLADGNREFELELLRLFLDDTHIHLEKARAAIATQNFLLLEQEAHHIKGAGANVGANSIWAAAMQLEQQSQAQQLEGATELLGQIERALDSLQSCLESPSA